MPIELIVLIVTAAARRHDLAAVPARGSPAGPAMSGFEILALVITIALAVYLVVALLMPEKFQ